MDQIRWQVIGKVKTVQGDPVRGATVIVLPAGSATPHILATDPYGAFMTWFSMLQEEVHSFSVLITVKKKGFQTAHSYVNYGNSSASWWIPFTLYEAGDDDPDLLPQADLISGLAPKLRQLGPAEGLSARSQKDYEHGVADFLDQHISERAVPRLWKVAEDNPSCIACRTMLALAELDWHAWDDATESLKKGVNATVRDPKTGRPEPLVAYGTWLSWQHDPEKAAPYFWEALKLAPQDALVLQELGRALLATQQFEGANEYLKKALAAGAGTEARLLYIKSCLGVGRTAEATAEMNRYLEGRDVKKMPLRVRKVWVSIQDREKIEATYSKSKPQKGQAHLDFLHSPPADLIAGLEPAKDQELLGSILDGAGTRILDMTQNFPNTSSLELIHQEKLGSKGEVRSSQNQKFRYLCMMPHRAWGPSFKEYRGDSEGGDAQPKGIGEGFMLTKGFASTALIFHPAYRSESTFHYLGRQNVNGRSTFVVAFAQIPGKAHLIGNFQQGETSLTTFSQGLAWIDASSYQIIRLHTDLLTPLPELRLKREALNVNFNEVHFKQLKDAFWLPGEVTLTIDWNGKVLRNTHEYSDFKVFNVDASEKIGSPKRSSVSSQGPQETTVTP